jgi:phage shock protein PspC (stress-responsive transcriptional regulator)
MIQPMQRHPRPPDWCYERDGSEFGPTDFGGLQAMADCGHLLPACPVWQLGSPERVPADDVGDIHFRRPEAPAAQIDSRCFSLYRSSDERIVFGVCGGFAHRLGMPVIVIRATMLLLCFGMVGCAYLFGVFLPALPTKNVRRETVG